MFSMPTAKNGSSPRTRGTPRCLRVSSACSSVHPRARGEHHPCDCGGAPGLRFIPAHAGNTAAGRRTRAPVAVHPRARGEHHHLHADGRLRLRFIPAHAGNTSAAAIACASCSVHPRARGEHAGHHQQAAGEFRFIPAHAGNTTRIFSSRESTNGSSPRTRGTHFEKTITYARKAARSISGESGNYSGNEAGTTSPNRLAASRQAASCTAIAGTPSNCTTVEFLPLCRRRS